MYQVEMINLDEWVPKTLKLRKFARIWSFESAQLMLIEKDNSYQGEQYTYKTIA